MVYISVVGVSYYGIFSLIFKEMEDTATQGLENWKLSTTTISIEALSHENPSEHPYTPYIARN